MARPSKGDRVETKIRIPRELHDELNVVAEAMGVTRQDLLVLAVDKLLSNGFRDPVTGRSARIEAPGGQVVKRRVRVTPEVLADEQQVAAIVDRLTSEAQRPAVNVSTVEDDGRLYLEVSFSWPCPSCGAGGWDQRTAEERAGERCDNPWHEPRERMSYDTHPDRVDSPSSYAAGWNDAKAGRQYGEGRHGPRVSARSYPVCLGMADGMCTRFADGGSWCPDGTCEEQGG